MNDPALSVSDEPAAARGWRASLGWMVLTNPGAFTMVLGPVFTIAFVSGQGLSAAAAAALGSAEMSGMALATLATGFLPLGKAARAFPAKAAALFVGAAFAAQCASLLVANLALLAIVRIVVGAGTGGAFTLAIAALARLPNPDRQFGLQMATNQLSIFLLMNVAAFAGGAGQVMAPIYLVVCATGLSLMAAMLLPRRAAGVPSGPEDGASSPAIPRLAAIAAIATCLTFNAGVGSFWPLVGQIAIGAGVSQAAISNALAWAPLSAIAGAMAAAGLAGVMPRLTFIVAVNVAMAVTMLVLAQPGHGALPFIACVSALMFCWLVVMPYYFGMLVALDPSGRLASSSGLLLAAGMAAGQALATLWLNFLDIGSLPLAGMGLLALASCLAIGTGIFGRPPVVR